MGRAGDADYIRGATNLSAGNLEEAPTTMQLKLRHYPKSALLDSGLTVQLRLR